MRKWYEQRAVFSVSFCHFSPVVSLSKTLSLPHHPGSFGVHPMPEKAVSRLLADQRVDQIDDGVEGAADMPSHSSPVPYCRRLRGR